MAVKHACFLLLALMLWILGSQLRGQTAEITGSVHDDSGAAITNAVVRVVNLATLVERRARTNDVGLCAVPYLAPGNYQIVIEAPGFQTAIADITLTVDQVLLLNIQLKVGEANISVDVKAPLETIDLNDAQLSGIVDSREMNTLPLILRDPYQLVALVAGVNPGNTQGFSVNGGRTSANNFRLDGADSNDVEGATGSIVTINPESTQEFRVLSNNFLPEYGRDNGAVIDVITKSGTNQSHGAVYELGRWSGVGGARDFFNRAGTHKAPYIRNILGVTFGGPIVKNKTFFFFNLEAQRFATTTIGTSFVPTAAFLTGKFTFTGRDPKTGDVISVPIDVSNPNSAQNTFHLSLDPTIQKVFSHHPAGPAASSPDGIGAQIFFPNPDHFSGNNITLKIDHNFSSSEDLSVRYIGNPSKDDGGSNDFLPGIGDFPFAGVTQLGAAHLVSTFSSRWLNDILFAVNNVNSHNSCGSLGILNSVRTPDQFGHGTDFNFADNFPVWGCPAQTNGFTQVSGTYSLSDHMVRILGRHRTTFGFEFARLHSNTTFGIFSRPQISFGNFLDFGMPAAITDTPVDAIESLQDSLWALFGEVSTQIQAQFFNSAAARLPNDLVHMRENDYALFWQDSFKAAKNLTLNYGLRWELDGAPYEADNLLSTASLATLSGPAPVVFHVAPGPGQSLYPSHRFASEPRIGFVWDPFGYGTTSVRGAYGIFRDHLFFAAANSVRGNPPLTQQQTQFVFAPAASGFSGSTVTALPIPGDFVPSAVVQEDAGVFALTVDPNLHRPYSQNWNFGIQHEFPGNTQLELNYVGVQGKRLLSSIDGNAPDPAKVAALRLYCRQTNPFNCRDGQNLNDAQETVQGQNLYFGQELGILPFDAVMNNAILHAQVIQTAGNSTYNALQATVTKRYARGMYLRGAYTWSHEIDDAAGDFGPSANNAILPANSHDLRQERGNGAQDTRQALVMDFTADLPLGTGKSIWSRGVWGKVLEGWTLAGIVRFQGGFPYDIFGFRDSQGTALTGGERPDYNPHGNTATVRNTRTQTGPNPGLFRPAAFGSIGNLHRNTFRVPYTNNWDAALSKNTHLGERLNLEFRAEAYNVFNRVQFGPPVNFIDSPTFGQSFVEVARPDGTTGARQMQFGLKLKF